jgi:hypothetical protein
VREQRRDLRRGAIIDRHIMACIQQIDGHAGPHLTEPDKSDLHAISPFATRDSSRSLRATGLDVIDATTPWGNSAK